MKNLCTWDWIQTYTGKKFYPLNPRCEDVCIEDIAHALSLLCRFVGHIKEFYSVAQHSVLVSRFAPPGKELFFLLHDAAEAYLGDVSRPIKKHLQVRSSEVDVPLALAEKKLLRVICRRFGVEMCLEEVRLADDRMLATEARDLTMGIHPDWDFRAEPYEFTVVPEVPKLAEERFLQRFLELAGQTFTHTQGDLIQQVT